MIDECFLPLTDAGPSYYLKMQDPSINRGTVLHLRAFTLVPLLELIPDFEHPVLHKTISELHNDLENPEMVFLYGTRVDI